MEYNEFGKEAKWYINGVVAKYMDSYIRENLIWTPEQMYLGFLEYKKETHENGWFGYKTKKDSPWFFGLSNM